MKPLELTVYDLEAFPHLTAKARTATRRKRLTDAELAAEYWAACAVVERAIHGGSGFVIPLARERNTMERFATHPHYDEAQS